MAKGGGMKKSKYMAKGGAMKGTKYMSMGGAVKSEVKAMPGIKKMPQSVIRALEGGEKRGKTKIGREGSSKMEIKDGKIIVTAYKKKPSGK